MLASPSQRKRQKPFKPTSKLCPFEDASKLFDVEKPPIIKNEIEVDGYYENLIDAESGETIALSKARWNVQEGRLNMDAKTILFMSTGKLDIKKRSSKNNESLPPISQNKSEIQHRHPLITKFLLEGPRNARFHKDWNKRTDSVDINEMNAMEIAEEDADYYDETLNNNILEYNTSRMQSNTDNLLATIADNDLIQSTHQVNSINGDDTPNLDTNKDITIPSSSSSTSSKQSRISKQSGSKHSTSSNLQKLKRNYSSNLTVNSHNTYSTHNTTHSTHSGTRTLHTIHSRGNHSHISSGSKGSTVVEINPYIDAKIVTTNKDNWDAVEERVYQEVFNLASQMEANKTLTQEAKLKGGMREAMKNCRYLARLKVKNMKEVVQAVDDEKRKEEAREQEALDSLHKPLQLQEIMKKNQQDDRRKAKLYLTALQQDQEIMFIHKLSEFGYLW